MSIITRDNLPCLRWGTTGLGRDAHLQIFSFAEGRKCYLHGETRLPE